MKMKCSVLTVKLILVILSPVQDWVRLVQSDKSELGIALTDEEIQVVPKNVFRKYVMKRATTNHLK